MTNDSKLIIVKPDQPTIIYTATTYTFIGSGSTNVSVEEREVTIHTPTIPEDLINVDMFTGHTSNVDIHYPMSGITITKEQVSDFPDVYTKLETYTKTEVDNLISPDQTLQVAQSFRIDSGTLVSGVLEDTWTINDIVMEYAPMSDIYYLFPALEDFNYLRIRYRCDRPVYVLAYNATLGWSAGFQIPMSTELTTTTIAAETTTFLPYVGQDTELEFYTGGAAEYFDLDFVGFIGGALPLEAIVENHIDDNTIHFQFSDVEQAISEATSGITSSWNDITEKPQWLSGTTLEGFQTGHTHSYESLTDKPTIPTEKIFIGSGNTTVTTSGDTYIIYSEGDVPQPPQPELEYYYFSSVYSAYSGNLEDTHEINGQGITPTASNFDATFVVLDADWDKIKIVYKSTADTELWYATPSWFLAPSLPNTNGEWATYEFTKADFETLIGGTFNTGSIGIYFEAPMASNLVIDFAGVEYVFIAPPVIEGYYEQVAEAYHSDNSPNLIVTGTFENTTTYNTNTFKVENNTEGTSYLNYGLIIDSLYDFDFLVFRYKTNQNHINIYWGNSDNTNYSNNLFQLPNTNGEWKDFYISKADSGFGAYVNGLAGVYFYTNGFFAGSYLEVDFMAFLTNTRNLDKSFIKTNENLFSGDYNDLANKPTILATNNFIGSGSTEVSVNGNNVTIFTPKYNSIIEASGATFTVNESHHGKIIELSNTLTTVVTLPTGITEGFECIFFKADIGNIQFIVEEGGVLRSKNGADSIVTQYAAATIYFKNNIWTLIGEIE